MYACMCVSAPRVLITIYMECTLYNKLNEFYSLSFPLLSILLMGVVCREHLPKKVMLIRGISVVTR